MHWSYQDYQEAPMWMLDLILPIVETEQKVAEIKANNDAQKRKAQT
jgi:hypothetical protein